MFNRAAALAVSLPPALAPMARTDNSGDAFKLVCQMLDTGTSPDAVVAAIQREWGTTLDGNPANRRSAHRNRLPEPWTDAQLLAIDWTMITKLIATLAVWLILPLSPFNSDEQSYLNDLHHI